MSSPLLSVVLVTWNRREEIAQALREVYNQTLNVSNYEVVVVDNYSIDGSAEYIERNYPDVRVIRLHRNVGCPEARNIGLVNARATIAICLDDDLTLENPGLERFLESFESDSEVGVVFGKVLNYHSGVLESPRFEFGDGEGFDKPIYTRGFYATVSGYRTDVLHRVGFYPSNFFRQGEEGDLSFRLLDAGFRILYQPGIVGLHRVSPVARSPRQMIYHATRNELWIKWKYLPLRHILPHTLWVLWLHLSANFKSDRFLPFLAGVLAAFSGVAGPLRERRPVAHRTIALMNYLRKCPVYSPEEYAHILASLEQ